MENKKVNGLKGIASVLIRKVDNGFLVSSYSEISSQYVSVQRVSECFTNLVNDLAEIFEVPDGDNIAKGG